jgi:hypothetical protein
VLARCSGPLPSPSPQAPSPADRETVARRPVPSGDDLSTFDRSTLLRESGDSSPPVRGGGRFGEPGRSDTAPVPAAAATVRDLRDRARTVPSAPQPPVGSGRGRGRVRLPRRAGRFLTVAVLLAVTAWPGNAMLQDTLWMRRRHAAAEGERLLPGSTCEGIGYDDKKWKYFPECLIQVHRSSGRSLWVNATIFPDPRHNTSETFDTSRYGSDWAKVKTDLLSGCTRSSGDVFLDGSAGNVDRYYALRTQGTTDVLCYEVVMKPNGTPKVWAQAQLWIRDRKRDAWAKVGYGIKQSAGFESGPQIQQLTMDGGKPLTVAEWDQLWEVSDTVFKHLPAT